jgi:hypothetical protein
MSWWSQAAQPVRRWLTGRKHDEGSHRAERRVMTLRRWVPLAAAIPAAAGLALSLTGVIELPDLSSVLEHLSRRLGAWTYLLVAGLAFLETAAFVGLIAPGETALALGGLVAAHGQVSLVPMIAIAWAGAAGGDLVSFTVGGRVGRSALTVYGPRLGFTPQRLARVAAFSKPTVPRRSSLADSSA